MYVSSIYRGSRINLQPLQLPKSRTKPKHPVSLIVATSGRMALHEVSYVNGPEEGVRLDQARQYNMMHVDRRTGQVYHLFTVVNI